MSADKAFTVTVSVSSSTPGAYYLSTLFSHPTNTIIGIATSGTDVYFLDQISSTSFALEKVDATGTVTSLATTTTALWKDIAVAGGFLFVLQSITTTSTTYSALRYTLSNFSTPSTLTLPATPKKFATDGGNMMYLSGSTTSKGIMYFDVNAFTTVFTAKTVATYTGLAFRTITVEATVFGYLYGTRGSSGAGEIDEIPVSSLSTSSASPVTVFPCPSETVTPGLIRWIPEPQSFLITDQNPNGSLGNGPIYSYELVFNATTGALSSITIGPLLIRGNSNSGPEYTETQFARSIPCRQTAPHTSTRCPPSPTASTRSAPSISSLAMGPRRGSAISSSSMTR